MLKIRKDQYEELGKVSLKRFEDSMVEHIKEFFPKYYEIHKEPLIRKIIQYGVDRAESYGFETKRDTPLFIDLMFLLGSHFDEDIQYPWAKNILADKSISDPTERADKLYDTGVEFLDEVTGKQSEYLDRALIRIRDTSFDDFADYQTPNAPPRIGTFLMNIWPQKAKKLGSPIISRLIQKATLLARNNNMSIERGLAVISTLMFMLGSGFAKDPQFPWAASVLKSEMPTSPADKTNQLYKEAVAFMQKWLT
ncbi:MAG: hypothetical protein ACYTBJ_02615 [Planctomycetota bacterium]|jgi:hypothetical protein